MGRFDALDAMLKRFTEQGPPGCSCSVVQNGQTLFESHAGMADLAAGRPVAPDTIYRIFSMSKVITCTAALMLYERGLFLINDPLSDYMPEFRDMRVHAPDCGDTVATMEARGPIRIRDLFAMTSGLQYPGGDDPASRGVAAMMKDLADRHGGSGRVPISTFASEMAKLPLAFEPGTRWRYGMSHDILGALIERLTGKPFGRFLEETIFEPLGMRDTCFHLPQEKASRLAAFYDRPESGTLVPSTAHDASYAPDAVSEYGGGGLLSTLGDYQRFAQMLACGGEWAGRRYLGSRTVDLMRTNVLTPELMKDYCWPYLAGYGYGLGVRTMIDAAVGGVNSSPGEFGWSGMAGTFALIDPALKLSIVYMQQMLPNLEEYHQPRIRAVVYGAVG